MRRETAVSFFMLALIGIAKFGFDIATGIARGQWEAVMIGFWGSFAGLVVSIIIVLGVGRWLIGDDKARRKREQERHEEIIKILKDIANK